jgi:hypothetical protein
MLVLGLRKIFRSSTSGNTYGNADYDVTRDSDESDTNNGAVQENNAVDNYKYSWDSDETATEVQSTVNE